MARKRNGRPAGRGRARKTARSKTAGAKLRRRARDAVRLDEVVADGFATDRFLAPPRSGRRAKAAVRELGWAAFGEVARAFAARIARRYRPSIVVGVAKGGIFAGGALAAALGAEFYPVRIEKRRRDAAPKPEVARELPDLRGKRVLVVDDVANTGATLARARALARKAGAAEVRTAVLVSRPHGARPDFSAIDTDELVLFGWDYQLEGSGPVDPGEVGV